MRVFLVLFILLNLCTPAHAGKTILVMGDSLSAGYGLQPQEAWPALLGQRLSAKRSDYSVANHSISGETTAGGRSRMAEALRREKPTVVIIELGANDGLRGLPLNTMRDNLNAMIEAARGSGARILLVGMRLPPNYGPYAKQFEDSFAQVARNNKLAFLPFLLEPVATRPELFLPDNLHPTAAAQPLLLDHLWPSLQALLK